MADNVPITAGAGTDIATDQLVGGEHVQIVKLADGTPDSGTRIAAGGGAEAGALRVTMASDSTGVVSIDDNGASITVDGSVAAAGAGDVAHDAADSGNPVKVGLKAIAHKTSPTAVAAADRTDWYGNRHGIPFFMGGHPNTKTLRVNYTAAQTNAAIITETAGMACVVTQIQVVASNANTVSPSVLIGFGTATTPTGDQVVLAHPGVPPGGGCSRGDGSGLIAIGASDEDLRITSSVPTGGSIDVVVTYYQIES